MADKRFSLDDYTEGKVLGSGAQGSVQVHQLKDPKKASKTKPLKVAVKISKKIFHHEKHKIQTDREMDNLYMKGGHPNILGYYGVEETKTQYKMVMELCDSDLVEYCAINREKSEERIGTL